jgi:hypothetical protein
MLEGMQIAFFACAKLRKEERGTSKFAKMTADLLFKGDGNNLPGFMVGRQLTVVSCMFFVARVTSVKMAEGAENMFGVSDGVQELFNSGLLGALFLTIVGSIAWQLVASAFPIAFMDNPLTYVLLRIALAIEFTGVCNGAWVLAAIHAQVAGFQRDEAYIGTAAERAAKESTRDHLSNLHMGPGHMVKLPGDHLPDCLTNLMNKDPMVRSYIESLHKKGDVEEGEPSDDEDPNSVVVKEMKSNVEKQAKELENLKEMNRLQEELQKQQDEIESLKETVSVNAGQP